MFLATTVNQSIKILATTVNQPIVPQAHGVNFKGRSEHVCYKCFSPEMLAIIQNI